MIAVATFDRIEVYSTRKMPIARSVYSQIRRGDGSERTEIRDVGFGRSSKILNEELAHCSDPFSCAFISRCMIIGSIPPGLQHYRNAV
jgi:hypothetical protein